LFNQKESVMQRTEQVRKMGRGAARRGWKTMLALGFCCVLPAAHAAIATFEGLSPALVGHGDTFEQAGLLMTGFSLADDAMAGDLVGALVDGSDPGVCAGLACPANNSSSFYAALNDGGLLLDPVNSGGTFSIKSFDASFIGAVAGATYPAVAGLLRVQGFFANGDSAYETYALDGPGANGFQFRHFDTSAQFGNLNFSEVALFGFTCDVAGVCDAFSSNRGQFALDSIVTAVPEPSAHLLLLAGLACIAGLARVRLTAQE
jgi:hypothetical protein